MKACKACGVTVESRGEFCPLCGEPLAETGVAPQPQQAGRCNLYPDLHSRTVQHNFILRLLVFVSLLGCGVSVMVNLLVHSTFMWSLIVVAAVLYSWITIPPLLRRGVNYAARTVLIVIVTSALVVVLDLLTGYRGWSVSYVIPGLLAAGIVSIGMMIVFNRTSWARYVLSQVIMGVFGFVPLVLYAVGLGSSLVMALLAAGFALASLLVTIVFGDRTIKSEFKRRFHI